MNDSEELHVWMDKGRIMFGSPSNRFGVKELICKELYEHGFKPQRDMTAAKIVGLAVLFTGPTVLVIHKGIQTEGIKSYLNNYKGVFGEVEIVIMDTDTPGFCV